MLKMPKLMALGLEKLCDKLPRALEGIKPILIYPLVGVFAIGVVMCAINPFVGMINTAVYGGLESLNGASAILLGAVVAGMMAIDMGGPFNKAAYLFGTASLVNAAGQAVNSPTMAAVMAVSYTHLDVYKRQPFKCWMAPEMPQAMYRLPLNFWPDMPT